jgi:CO/xanthine dehydrogenase Mo-binding subunit
VLRRGSGSVTMGQAALAAGGGGPLTLRVEHNAPQSEDTMYFCAQVAEVTVDPDTGKVTLDRLVTAHDVGTVINPVTHQGQIDGGAMTGVGLALTEEIGMEDGQVTTLNLGEYKLPTIAEMPELRTVLVTSGGGLGPYEAAAIGELANNSPPAAVANAVADAVGARLFELPVTAERVYRALRAR